MWRRACVMPTALGDAASSSADPLIPSESAGCLTMHFEAHPTLGAVLRMEAASAPITDEAIDLLERYSLRACERGEKFGVLWDLRQCQVPGMRQTWRCIRWGTEHKATLDARMETLAVLLGEDDRLISSVVGFVLKICLPAVPTLVSNDVAAVRRHFGLDAAEPQREALAT